MTKNPPLILSPLLQSEWSPLKAEIVAKAARRAAVRWAMESFGNDAGREVFKALGGTFQPVKIRGLDHD